MATYAEYDEALKKQDSWWEWYRRCARFDQPLTGPAVGNGGDNMLSCLEKAYDRIMGQSVWYGEDALACARLIDWERGNPYVFRKEDFALIKSSPAMFARKFNLTVDGDIVDMVLHSIK